MNPLYLLPVAFTVAGMGRRIAGGVLNQWCKPNGGRVTGDLPVRLLFSASVAVWLLFGPVWWHALVAIPAVFIGTTLGNYEGLAMGRGQYPWLHDFESMTRHGIDSAAAPVGLAIGLTLDWAHLSFPVSCLPWAIAGLLGGVAYEIGWKTVELLPGGNGNNALPVGFKGGSEVAEVVFGGFFGVAALVAAYLGM